ncbi:MAG: alpha-galactosidase [Candidatus Brocadiia bacterium]
MQGSETTNDAGVTLKIAEDGFGIYHQEREVGLWNLTLEMELNGEHMRARYASAEEDSTGISAEGYIGDSQIACETRLEFVEDGNAATIRHRVRNEEEGIVTHITNVRTSQHTEKGRGVWLPFSRPYDLRYCHTDNVRTERYPYCMTESPYVRSLPVDERHCGIGQDQPFPALYLTDRDYRNGIVVAALEENCNYQSYRLSRTARPLRSILETFEIRHEFPLAAGFALGLQGELELDGLYVELCETTHPQNAYLNYIDHLSETHDFRGPKTKLLDEALYCTWNYGRAARQVEGELLTTAEFISENMPNVTFFLVDAGYTFREVDRSGLSTNDSLDIMYNGPDEMLDPEKIPDMRAFSAKLRDMGLRPGLWWTPTAMLDSNLYKDHPDWFLRTETGAPYRIAGRKGFLDLTVPDARDFLDKTLSIILGEWDIDATKMDFWSQCFEAREGRHQRPNMTAVETRRILFDLVRKYLPEDGVFMTCVATGMGKPFIGQHADTYRNTIDIGSGTWDRQIGSCYWALPVLGIPGRKTFLHNNDSVGINLNCPENENFFRLTWGFITMGMQEIGGSLEQLPEKYRRAMRKYTDRCERGFRCQCPDERAFTGEPLPESLYVTYPEDSRTYRNGVRQSLALFNWTDEAKVVSVKRSKLGQEKLVEAENFWTEGRERFDEEFITKRLDPRSAVLYDVLV